jgi:hypothetical protein
MDLRGQEMIAAEDGLVENTIAERLLQRKQREYSTRASADDVEVAIGGNRRPIEQRRHTNRAIDERLVVQQHTSQRNP